MSVCLSVFLSERGGGGGAIACAIFSFSQTQDLNGRKHLFDFSDGSLCMFFFFCTGMFSKIAQTIQNECLFYL